MQLRFLDHALCICNVWNRLLVSFPCESTGLLNVTSDNQSDTGVLKWYCDQIFTPLFFEYIR